MRKRDVTATLASAFAGSLNCLDPECPRSDAAPCAYLDDAGNLCGCAFCPDHLAVVDGTAYCLRHASTLRALEGSTLRPGINNRCPSLVFWVARDLDERIREILNLKRDELRETILSSPVQPGDGGGKGGGAIWTRTWSLDAGSAQRLKVAIEVAEGDPLKVVARIDGKSLGKWTPPWIEFREKPKDPGEDGQDRRRFNETILAAIETRVAKA